MEIDLPKIGTFSTESVCKVLAGASRKIFFALYANCIYIRRNCAEFAKFCSKIGQFSTGRFTNCYKFRLLLIKKFKLPISAFRHYIKSCTLYTNCKFREILQEVKVLQTNWPILTKCSHYCCNQFVLLLQNMLIYLPGRLDAGLDGGN